MRPIDSKLCLDCVRFIGKTRQFSLVVNDKAARSYKVKCVHGDRARRVSRALGLIDPRYLALMGSGGLVVAALVAPTAFQKPKTAKPVPSPSFAGSVAPVVKKYCVSCHAGGGAPAGVDLSNFPDGASVLKARELWSRVSQNVSSGHMPPDGAPAPTKAQREGMVRWLDLTLVGDCKLQDPGHVTMRRLNRREYDNTVRDLIGMDLNLSEDFPSDDVGYGFDNIGDVLSISPLLMEKYLKAAEQVATKVIEVPDNRPMHFDAENLKLTQGVSISEQGQVYFFSEGKATVEKYLTMGGTYRFKVEAYGEQAGPDPAKLAILIDGKPVQVFEVKATVAHPAVYETSLEVDPGKHEIGMTFTNDYYRPGPPPQDRNLVVKYLDVYKPAAKATAASEAQKRIIFASPVGADWNTPAKQVLARFAKRAFRRPPTDDELSRLVKIVDYVRKDGQPYEKCIQLCVQAILSSPQFLFRVERADTSASLNSYELASRLSYFLWSSMPDDELMALAGSGQLQKTETLKAEVKRMLQDPRAGSLADNFGEEWLNLRKLALINPDPAQFPDFDEHLRSAMMTETKMFFNGIVKNDRSIIDFLDAKYTYVNGPLAKHYGMTGVDGDEFRKVSLEGTPRAGVLTQASVLTLTSNPTRTSPVKRGKWVLEQILNTPPPPPPPNVAALPDDGKQVAAASLRAKMELHRKDPACATCHKKMDPLGFSLENFDATGGWRSKDGNTPIDASGVLPDGTKFQGAAELTGLLMKKKADFVRSLSEKLLTYSIGRGVESYDRCAVDAIAKTCESTGYRFSSLVTAVVTSDPFRKKRPVGGKSK